MEVMYLTVDDEIDTMTDCDFCDATFENDRQLHLHWLDEHENKLNSHQRDEAKQSKKEYEKEQERKKAQRSERMKTLAIYGAIGLFLIGIIAVIGWQLNLDRTPTGSGSLENLSLEDRQYLGSENASVTVIKWSDFQCHYCSQFDRQIFPQLKEEFIETGEIQYYHLHYPSLGQASQISAVASECVAQQNESAFWEYKTDLFEHQQQIGEQGQQVSFYTDLASDYENINQTDLQSCISTSETESIIQEDAAMGNQVGVSGTPHIQVGDTKIERWTNFDNIRDAIESRQ